MIRTIGKGRCFSDHCLGAQRTVRYTPNSLLIPPLVGMLLTSPDSPHRNLNALAYLEPKVAVRSFNYLSVVQDYRCRKS